MISERVFKRISIYRIYNFLGLIPMIWSFGLIIYYLIVAIVLGYFPTYGNPDPASIENNLIRNIGGIFVLLFLISGYCLYTFIGIFIIQVVYSFIKRKTIKYKKILFSVVGFLIFIGMLFIPGLSEIFGWLID